MPPTHLVLLGLLVFRVADQGVRPGSVAKCSCVDSKDAHKCQVCALLIVNLDTLAGSLSPAVRQGGGGGGGVGGPGGERFGRREEEDARQKLWGKDFEMFRSSSGGEADWQDCSADL